MVKPATDEVALNMDFQPFLLEDSISQIEFCKVVSDNHLKLSIIRAVDDFDEMLKQCSNSEL